MMVSCPAHSHAVVVRSGEELIQWHCEDCGQVVGWSYMNQSGQGEPPAAVVFEYRTGKAFQLLFQLSIIYVFIMAATIGLSTAAVMSWNAHWYWVTPIGLFIAAFSTLTFAFAVLGHGAHIKALRAEYAVRAER